MSTGRLRAVDVYKRQAIDMAVEEINAGDSGYKIEIVNGGKVADDAKDAKQAMNAYNKVCLLYTSICPATPAAWMTAAYTFITRMH